MFNYCYNYELSHESEMVFCMLSLCYFVKIRGWCIQSVFYDGLMMVTYSLG